jgi:hypothetical protein
MDEMAMARRPRALGEALQRALGGGDAYRTIVAVDSNVGSGQR